MFNRWETSQHKHVTFATGTSTGKHTSIEPFRKHLGCPR